MPRQIPIAPNRPNRVGVVRRPSLELELPKCVVELLPEGVELELRGERMGRITIPVAEGEERGEHFVYLFEHRASDTKSTLVARHEDREVLLWEEQAGVDVEVVTRGGAGRIEALIVLEEEDVEAEETESESEDPEESRLLSLPPPSFQL